MRLILDVDTGIDDALALVYASANRAIELAAVTCVAGNVDLDHVARNTSAVLHAVGADHVPLTLGADRSRVGTRVDAASVHGDTGLGSVELVEGRRDIDERRAALCMAETILESEEPTTLVALAPLTNVAELLDNYPDAAERLHSLMIMGGSFTVGGNHTAAAEFNFYADPEAASAVIASGLPITIFGLDVFNKCVVSGHDIEQLSAHAEPAARLVGELLSEGQKLWDTSNGPLGDAGAVVCTLAPDLLQTTALAAAVEVDGTHTRGALVCDQRPHREFVQGEAFAGRVVNVATEIDVRGVATQFIATASGQRSSSNSTDERRG